MRNLMYALEQLGGTPACEYSALNSQTVGEAVIVQFEEGDADLPDCGVGINTASGTTAVYLSGIRTINEPKTDSGILKYVSNSTDLDADLKSLLAMVRALASEWLSGTTAPDAQNAHDSTAASFTVAATGLNVTFTDTSTAVSPITVINWSWSFGDGTLGSTDQNPTHTYPLAGSFIVELIVTDSHNQQAYFWDVVTVA